MKYIFFGTPNFSAIILNKLIEAGMPPAAVVCNPDRPVGRKKIITPPPVKQLAANQETPIAIFQPENPITLRDSLLALRADLFIVAAYAKILPETIIGLPRLGVIGVHPSLLPKYRGATPIQSAILNDEKETGATLFLIDEKVDHGLIIANRKTQIANQNYQELEKVLAEIGADLLIEILLKLKLFSGSPTSFAEVGFPPRAQNESEATYTKKFKSGDAFVELKKDDPKIIYRKILALNPEPGVYTIINGKRVKLLEADWTDSKLKLKRVQIEGKKPTTLIDFLSF